MPAVTSYARSALLRRTQIQLGGITVAVAAPEDVIIAKLQWAKLGKSERQLQDAAGIVSTQGDRLERTYIERWVRELHLEQEWQVVVANRP